MKSNNVLDHTVTTIPICLRLIRPRAKSTIILSVKLLVIELNYPIPHMHIPKTLHLRHNTTMTTIPLVRMVYNNQGEVKPILVSRNVF